MTTSEIIEAAKMANAYDFIQGFPDGLDTLVGERGIMLSGELCKIVMYSFHNERIVSSGGLGVKHPVKELKLFQKLISRLTTLWVDNHIKWRCRLHWIIKNKGGC